MADSHTSSVEPRRPIPGEREPGRLSRFGRAPAISLGVPERPGMMDAGTVAERQREGGGAPNERRAPREPSRWNGLVEFLKSF